MFCAKCGTQNSDENRFCKGCGVPLAENGAPAPAAPMPIGTVEARAAQEPQLQQKQASFRKCPKCSREFSLALRFCETDGTPLQNIAPFANEEQNLASEIDISEAPAEISKEKTNKHRIVNSPPQAELANEVVEERSASLSSEAPASVFCSACGRVFPAGVRFCDQDGTLLVDQEATTIVRDLPPVVADLIYRGEVPDAAGFANDDDESDGGYGRDRNRLVPSLIASALVIAVVGGGYAYWSGQGDRWPDKKPNPPLTGAAADAAAADAAAAAARAAVTLASANGAGQVQPPKLLGQYIAHLADQDIVLTIEGASPKSLASSAGTISYLNVVNGGTCTASLVPANGGGIGGGAGNVVSFRQMAVPGKPACSADIPVKMDVSGQTLDEIGVVHSIAVEWRSPNSNTVLMAGKLEREQVK